MPELPDNVKVEYREDQSICITVHDRSCIVHSAHLVDERIAQLSRSGWGMPYSEPLTVRESNVIARMKQSADPYLLWSEVKHEYDRCRKSGDCPYVASFHALYEWDLL